MIKLLLLAVVPFMTEHRNVTPKTEVSTNFYGSVTGIVDNAYIQAHGGGGGGVDTNAVRDIAREEIVPATNRLNQTLSDALDNKRDKDDLAVYEVVRTENTDLKLTTNVVDRLATTNGVNEAISENNVGYRVRESVAWSGVAELAMNANGVRSADETRSGAMLFEQIDGKAKKTDLDGYLSLTGGYLKGPVYFDQGGRIYTDQGGIYVNTHQGLNVYGGGSIVLESNECLTDFDNNPIISGTNPSFSNAVLSVGLNIDTNSVAVLNEIASTFGGFPVEGTATTVGGLLAALAAAIAWLKKKALVGGLTGGVPDDPKVHDFFTDSNSLLNGRLAYSRNATGLKDRAFNTLSFDGTEFNLSTALEEVTPTAVGQPRDLLIVATATSATTIGYTAGTIKGDKPTIDGSGTWLITLTEYASGVWYCRQIKMEDAA